MDPGFGGPATIGAQYPQVFGVDQCAEQVDVYHLGGGPPIIVSIHAAWSPPDQDFASWLGGGSDGSFDLSAYQDVRQAVWDGDLRWIQLLWEAGKNQPATATDVLNWANTYPATGVPVLAGADVASVYAWQGVTFLPNLILLDSTFEVLGMTQFAGWAVLDQALTLL